MLIWWFCLKSPRECETEQNEFCYFQNCYINILYMRNKTDIFHFIHIDPTINKAKLSEIKLLYTYYFWKFWSYKQAYKYFKRLNLAINIGLVGLRWLDWVFWGEYLPSLSINHVGMSKDMGKRLPQLYYIKMKISYDLGFIAIGVTMATKWRFFVFYLSLRFSVLGVFF